MISQNVTPQDLVNFLNELMKTDQQAINSLVSLRVNCNSMLAQHPTVQVSRFEMGPYKVGLIGLLNGLFGIHEGGKYDGWGCLVYHIDDEDPAKNYFSLLENVHAEAEV